MTICFRASVEFPDVSPLLMWTSHQPTALILFHVAGGGIPVRIPVRAVRVSGSLHKIALQHEDMSLTL